MAGQTWKNEESNFLYSAQFLEQLKRIFEQYDNILEYARLYPQDVNRKPKTRWQVFKSDIRYRWKHIVKTWEFFKDWDELGY